MKKMLSLLIVCALPLTLLGCPPPPPFSGAGTYVGTWQGQEAVTEMKQGQEVASCPLTITLTQNVGQNGFGAYAVQGTVEVDYSCIDFPEWVTDVPQRTVNVSGLMQENGKIGLLSGGCGTGICVALGLDGQGVDSDDDGLMDTYAGTWSYRILLAGVAPFGFDGTFTVERSLQ